MTASQAGSRFISTVSPEICFAPRAFSGAATRSPTPGSGSLIVLQRCAPPVFPPPPFRGKPGAHFAALPRAVSYRDYLPQTKLRVHALPPTAFEAEVLGHAQALTNDGLGYACFAGEFQNAQQLRGHFKTALGMGKTCQICTAYWRRD